MGAYGRMTLAERKAIEKGLSARKGCREIARGLGRTPSAVSEEVRRNRTLAERSSRGMRPKDGAEGNPCPRMHGRPWTRDTCLAFPHACGRHPRCECRALYAQRLADERASESRRGINAREEDFERIAFAVRDDVARGLSPEQVCLRHPRLGLSPSTLYRWIGRGIDFDMLEPRDCSVLMSHLNSEPRPSLMGMSPFRMMRAADPEAADAVMGALGLEEVPPGALDMTPGAIDADRRRRGLEPLL